MNWKEAALINKNPVSTNVYSLIFNTEDWHKHIPGQHYDIRLTSESGYQAQRSYSIASAPGQKDIVQFGVQLLDDGEVSPYLINQLQQDEKIEIKGPLGGHFIWDISMPGPLLLIAGGSGVVPFLSMLRHYRDNLGKVQPRAVELLISAQDGQHIPFNKELQEFLEIDPTIKIVLTLTRKAPPDWDGYQRRVDKEMLREVFGKYLKQMPMIFICGKTSFVESVANTMVDLGFQSHFIKTERYGG